MNLISRLLVSGAIFLALRLHAIRAPDPRRRPPRQQRRAQPAHYAMEDFASVRKLDAHVHINVTDPAFLEQARADGFELMSINVDYPDFPKLADQRAASLAQVQGPGEVHARARSLGNDIFHAGFRQAGLGGEGERRPRCRCGAGREGREDLEERGHGRERRRRAS